ncbi:TPA: GNAT family N-acetyltransferase [Serratia marcescens]|uniref:GNAT family N-acetyltransferase n=1 Tax=Serratia TaxID=613 RepID=UPI000B22F9CA|nr:GNAT family N-acetyltransferase [Serratia marcescens]MBH1904642.1 GNAT family N-acetyltransferase [Serratia marcescens]MBH2605157.1 GNAT family N-acetyltransferase [Serratia marcescens]MDU7766876.1 GNAT family N-acetyltransferase [Serratia marcescens]MDU7862027.1 GNAT family N-acetyltransferase [Serratia marcescens]PZQ31164.1 MAG: GNAT family N-acetyltransferase [Serratia marcescens]
MPVRLATETDAAALIALDSVALREPQRAAQIRAWCAQGICYLAEERGVVMGYGVLHYHFFGCGFIEMLMVGERYRRRGVGLVLIAALKSHCRHPKLFTSTNRSNLAMQRLLLNAGFVASGQIDNLDDGDPEQVFFIPAH